VPRPYGRVEPFQRAEQPFDLLNDERRTAERTPVPIGVLKIALDAHRAQQEQPEADEGRVGDELVLQRTHVIRA
jgi:hypothetical protein